MKLKQLINGGALAATVLTLGSAQAEERNPYDGIVFCKAYITDPYNGDEENRISVTLPFTSTSPNGLQYTWWNLGYVPAGGVADSWHSAGGPGKFVAHNDGRQGAYIYLTSTSLDGCCCYASRWGGNTEDPAKEGDVLVDDSIIQEVYGYDVPIGICPASSLAEWKSLPNLYCLAFTRDVAARTPTWHMLSREWDGYGWYEGLGLECGYIGAYMGYLEAGDYMPFDVKFWAPRDMCDCSVMFTFRVEAAAFPLWEHDIEVQ